MEGKQAFIEKGKQLIKNIEEKEEKETQTLQTVKNQLATVKQNQKLAQMYQESAEMGSKNLAASLPLLKVHATGKSMKNQLIDGTEPQDGYFFYMPTKEQYKTIECHVLSVSRGYKAKGMEEGKDTYNQIMSGIIINDGTFKPFIMYFTGIKLRKLWDFGKEASLYTKNPNFTIPLFALQVRLTTEKVKTNFGMSWVINFEIMKNEENEPLLVTDERQFNILRQSVIKVEDMVSSLIESSSIVSITPSSSSNSIDKDAVEQVETADTDGKITEDDIPF